jgi:isomerase DpgB
MLLVHIDGSGTPDGGDLWPSETGIHLVNQWERALRGLERIQMPVLAIVDGACRGPAFELLLATDYRLGTANAILEVCSVAGSVWPGMALYRMATQIGMTTVRRMMVLGEPVLASEAVEIGLLDEVPHDIQARVATMREGFSRTPGKEFAIRRQLLAETANTSFEDALGTHLAACDRAMRRNAIPRARFESADIEVAS